jgi:hypothetical protein
VEAKEQIQVKTSKKFSTLENLEHTADINEGTLEATITNFRQREFNADINEGT